MSGGQIAALIFALLLLLPGGCFLVFGIGFATDRQLYDVAFFMLPLAAAILGLAGFLFWIAFRRRAGPGGPPGRAVDGCAFITFAARRFYSGRNVIAAEIP